jgi:hypothetical protein
MAASIRAVVDQGRDLPSHAVERFQAERISSGPSLGNGAAAPFRLKFSAAVANDDSGATARAAHTKQVTR